MIAYDSFNEFEVDIHLHINKIRYFNQILAKF